VFFFFFFFFHKYTVEVTHILAPAEAGSSDI